MTLIDVALLMTMLGLILVPLISQFNRWKIDNERGLTIQRYASINKAISDYYFENDSYPCPARPDAKPEDADYGQAACGNPDLNFSGNTVMIGAVPFATLKIPTETGLDGWSNKITYAVTAAQTIAPVPPATLAPAAIRIRGGQQMNEYVCDMTVVDLAPGGVHYLLVSHGPSATGAFTADGTQRGSCPAAGAAADAENCINDNQFVNSACMESTVNGPEFYDDMVEYKANVPTRIWMDTLSANGDIVSNVENIGINNTNPKTSLHVRGNIKALNTDSSTICAEDGEDCFTSTMIGGTDPLMKCDSNPASTSSAMSGIGEARAKCQSGYTAFKVECPDGHFIKRLEADGGLVCGN